MRLIGASECDNLRAPHNPDVFDLHKQRAKCRDVFLLNDKHVHDLGPHDSSKPEAPSLKNSGSGSCHKLVATNMASNLLFARDLFVGL